MKKIIIAGGTGFIGARLSDFLSEQYEIIILSRRVLSKVNKNDNVRYVHWDGKKPDNWVKELENAEVVINLSGSTIDCRFTEKNKILILQSRIDSTRAIGYAITLVKNPPKTWINFSAVGYYAESESKPHDEFSTLTGTDFLSEVAEKWEKTFSEFNLPKTRKIILRISLVLDSRSKIIQTLLPFVRFGLGGKAGNGKQMISWIHTLDLCRLILWLFTNNNAVGVYNASSPNPVSNEVFMSIFRKKAKSGFGIPAPKWLIKITSFMLNKDSSLLLNSVNVIPKKSLSEGFEFIYSNLDECMQQIITDINGKSS